LKFIIDRTDDGIAVLVAQDACPFRITVPSLLLPPGSHEGDIVTLSLERDEEETSAARSRVTDLLETIKKQK
jgi:hypothetical protein